MLPLEGAANNLLQLLPPTKFLRPRGSQGKAIGKSSGRRNVGQLLQRLRAAVQWGKFLVEKRRRCRDRRGGCGGRQRLWRRRRLRFGFAASTRRGRTLIRQQRKTQLNVLFFCAAVRRRGPAFHFAGLRGGRRWDWSRVRRLRGCPCGFARRCCSVSQQRRERRLLHQPFDQGRGQIAVLHELFSQTGASGRRLHPPKLLPQPLDQVGGQEVLLLKNRQKALSGNHAILRGEDIACPRDADRIHSDDNPISAGSQARRIFPDIPAGTTPFSCPARFEMTPAVAG